MYTADITSTAKYPLLFSRDSVLSFEFVCLFFYTFIELAFSIKLNLNYINDNFIYSGKSNLMLIKNEEITITENYHKILFSNLFVN